MIIRKHAFNSFVFIAWKFQRAIYLIFTWVEHCIMWLMYNQISYDKPTKIFQQCSNHITIIRIVWSWNLSTCGCFITLYCWKVFLVEAAVRSYLLKLELEACMAHPEAPDFWCTLSHCFCKEKNDTLQWVRGMGIKADSGSQQRPTTSFTIRGIEKILPPQQ